MRRYFSGSKDVWFLFEQPLASAADLKALIDLGIATLPRRIQFSDGLPPGMWEYSTRPATTENYNLHGLDDFLESLEATQSFEDKVKAVRILWGYLKEHLEGDSWFFEGRHHWFYRTGHSKFFDSQMLTRLRNTKWIPTRVGSMEKPGEINTTQLRDDFQGAEKLLKALGIRHGVGPRASCEEDQKREHANMLGVSLEDIEFLKMHQDEVARLKAEIASRNDRPAFPTRAVTNPERRQERIMEQLSESPEKVYEERERNVRTTRGAIDPALWLRKQYTNDDGQMVCQICKEEMPFRKRDGEYYFEAVEALSKDYFSREHEAQFLALCPLCVAMYREFVKLDERLMEELRNALKGSDRPEVSLTLGRLETSIWFAGSHFIDIKTILGAGE